MTLSKDFIINLNLFIVNYSFNLFTLSNTFRQNLLINMIFKYKRLNKMSILMKSNLLSNIALCSELFF